MNIRAMSPEARQVSREWGRSTRHKQKNINFHLIDNPERAWWWPWTHPHGLLWRQRESNSVCLVSPASSLFSSTVLVDSCVSRTFSTRYVHNTRPAPCIWVSCTGADGNYDRIVPTETERDNDERHGSMLKSCKYTVVDGTGHFQNRFSPAGSRLSSTRLCLK